MSSSEREILLLNNQDVEKILTIFANGGYGWGHDVGPGYGIQFTAMAKLIYDLAKDRGVGRKLPLAWFQRDVKS